MFFSICTTNFWQTRKRLFSPELKSEALGTMAPKKVEGVRAKRIEQTQSSWTRMKYCFLTDNILDFSNFFQSNSQHIFKLQAKFFHLKFKSFKFTLYSKNTTMTMTTSYALKSQFRQVNITKRTEVITHYLQAIDMWYFAIDDDI